MEPIGPDYIYELTNVSEPSLSSDGSEVAFAISSFDRKRVKKKIRNYDNVTFEQEGCAINSWYE